MGCRMRPEDAGAFVLQQKGANDEAAAGTVEHKHTQGDSPKITTHCIAPNPPNIKVLQYLCALLTKRKKYTL
jgi:hypothetical protein